MRMARGIISFGIVFSAASLALAGPPASGGDVTEHGPVMLQAEVKQAPHPLGLASSPVILSASLLQYHLRANLAAWIRTLGLTGNARSGPSGFLSFMPRASGPIPIAVRVPGVSVGTTAKASPQPESDYKWLLRSQRRNVLRSERGVAEGRGGRREIGDHAGRSQIAPDLRTEISLLASTGSTVEGTGGFPPSFTNLKLAFPVLDKSLTSIQGRIGGESGYFTWTASANLRVGEIEAHSLDAGLQLGSILYQNGAGERDGGADDLFPQQWIARAYAHDLWKLSSRYGIAYGLSYQRTNYPTNAGFFNPNVALIADLGAGIRVDNHFAYGVNLPGRVSFFSGREFPESLPVSSGEMLKPERFTGYKARISKEIGSRQALEVGYAIERVNDPILQVPFLELGADGSQTYRILLANTQPLTSNRVRVGYKAQIRRNLSTSVSYRVGRAKGMGALQRDELGEPIPGQPLPGVDDRDIHTVSAGVALHVPSTMTTISGAYRWDSSLSLRADNMLEEFDDPTTQLHISVRQEIPVSTNGASNWEFMLDVRNPISGGYGDTVQLDLGTRQVKIIPHPRRVTGGLTLRF